mmetsp:Transcript_8163/g.18299  ORF Transcript_8163/g.18299 Transcript_8163/m.18299 type:complete len:565 (+) Transcript_8163:94-1788(+)
MVDSLISHQVALIKTETALAAVDKDSQKRKSRWSAEVVSKRGCRWGAKDERPYLPLTYVDLPIGFTDHEVDQFLREQRLEDLHRKIKTGHLELGDPDIREPSPPPTYDKSGNRTNRRETRVQKSMQAEYNRLIRYMLKTIPGYTPPPGWRPQRLVKKIVIPTDKYPDIPFMAIIVGARGVHHKRMQEETGARIEIRGAGVEARNQTDEETSMPQHVHLEADTEEQIEAAEKMVVPLLDPNSAEFIAHRDAGNQQLALINGYSINKADARCGSCGALGHYAYECPENIANYKMANVKCTICGDMGHVASDCKQNPSKGNTTEEALKQAKLDKEYQQMMGELGVRNGGGGAGGGGADGEIGPNEFLIHAKLVGRFIGPKGSNIQVLETSTQCKIQVIPGQVKPDYQKITVAHDNAETLEKGRNTIKDWLEKNKPPLNNSVAVNPIVHKSSIPPSMMPQTAAGGMMAQPGMLRPPVPPMGMMSGPPMGMMKGGMMGPGPMGPPGPWGPPTDPWGGPVGLPGPPPWGMDPNAGWAPPRPAFMPAPGPMGPRPDAWGPPMGGPPAPGFW